MDHHTLEKAVSLLSVFTGMVLMAVGLFIFMQWSILPVPVQSLSVLAITLGFYHMFKSLNLARWAVSTMLLGWLIMFMGIVTLVSGLTIFPTIRFVDNIYGLFAIGIGLGIFFMGMFFKIAFRNVKKKKDAMRLWPNWW